VVTDSLDRILNYGPFTIPDKPQWIIVGSGESIERLPAFFREHPDCGIISLNGTLLNVPYSTISFICHYEYFMMVQYLIHKPDIMFIDDPLPVGFRCVTISAYNMFDVEYFVTKLPNKIRFYERELDIERSITRPHTLYGKHGAGSLPVHLLARNNVREVYMYETRDKSPQYHQ